MKDAAPLSRICARNDVQVTYMRACSCSPVSLGASILVTGIKFIKAAFLCSSRISPEYNDDVDHVDVTLSLRMATFSPNSLRQVVTPKQHALQQQTTYLWPVYGQPWWRTTARNLWNVPTLHGCAPAAPRKIFTLFFIFDANNTNIMTAPRGSI